MEDYYKEFSKYKLSMNELFHNIVEFIDIQSKNTDRRRKVDKYNFCMLDKYFECEYKSIGLLNVTIDKIKNSKKPILLENFRHILLSNFGEVIHAYEDYGMNGIALDELFDRYKQ